MTTTLGERIRAAREHARLSQAELGGRIRGHKTNKGVSRAAVSQWESGKSAPTADKLGLIALETRVNAEWLFQERGPMIPIGSDISQYDLPRERKGRDSDMVPLRRAGEWAQDGTFDWTGEEVASVLAPPSLVDVKGAYAIRCMGTQMELRFFRGETLYVDPNRPVTEGCFVVVIFYPDGEKQPHRLVARVAQYMGTEGKVAVLRQLKPRREDRLSRSQIKDMHRIVGSGEV